MNTNCENRECRVCGETKALALFELSTRNPSGHKFRCLDCYNAHRRMRHARNPEAINTVRRDRYNNILKHTDSHKIAESNKRKSRYMRGIEHARQVRYRVSHYKAPTSTPLPADTIAPFSPYDVFNRDGWKCVRCECVVQKNDTTLPSAAQIDHVIPLSRGGAHTIDNAQTMCGRCNSIKGIKVLYPCTHTTIQRYTNDSNVSHMVRTDNPCQPCHLPASINPYRVSLEHRRTSHAQT